jgi:hypothetical protein
MNANYQQLRNNRQWKATTGLSQKQFEILTPAFAEAYEEIFGKSLPERQKDSPGEAHLRTAEDLLFFLLFSLKTGLTDDALGFVFGMDGSNANRNKQYSLRILRAALTRLGMMPKREFKDVKEFEAHLKAHQELILDGTEQRIQRPGNQQEQKECFSGKKSATLSKRL